VGRNVTIAIFAVCLVTASFFAVKQLLIIRGHFMHSRWPCVVSDDRGEEIATAISMWVLVAFFALAIALAI
jgi:hypothetical protein